MNLNESQILEVIREIMLPVIATGAHDFLDDGAELPPCPIGHTRVVSLDAFQEHNDFIIGLEPLESAGYRAIIQNLSDLAAMGAKPLGFLWSLELPINWLDQYLREFCFGALKACQTYGLEFYGGDLSASPDRFSCAVTIFGDVSGKPLGRRGAKSGNKIYVSRPLGITGEAEIELGQKLVGHATACMDISDGLAKDLYRLCKASGVGAHLQHIPYPEGVTLEQALYAGEDYALLFTAPSSKHGIEIGVITQKPGIDFNGPLLEKGFDHFKQDQSHSSHD